jgi:hypothetical protein
MFELFRFKRNNKNGKSYAVARSNLRFRNRPMNEDNNSNNPVEYKSDYEIKKEIDNLQTTVRYNNLKVYEKNIKAVRNRRFAVYTLPAVLVLVTSLFWLGPDSYEYEKNYDTYKKVETYFSDGKQLQIDDGITYCYSEFNKNFIDDTHKVTLTTTPFFEMYLLENGLGVYSNYSFNKEELLLNGDYVNEGSFVVDSIDASSGEEMSKLYSDMFDRALDILISSKKVDKDYRDFLNKIDNDTKFNFVGKLVEYEFIGNKDVPVVTDAVYARVVSTIITALYLFIFGIPALTRPIIECKGLEVYGSKLTLESEFKEHRFSELPLEYRSAFIAAETNRIMELARIADEYLTTDSKEKLFTEFEKKLILK